MLTVEQFGQKLIETGDLDPIYVMLNYSGLAWDEKAKFCLSYWCFYHAGFAAYCADACSDSLFWDRMGLAAINKDPCPVTKDQRWPRGTERRHFRGRASMASVLYLREHYVYPVDAITHLADGRSPPATLPFLDVRKRVMEWPAFGPWIGFKVADMMDAVLSYNVDFTGTEEYFFDDPKEGAYIVLREWSDDLNNKLVESDDNRTRYVVERLLKRFNSLQVAGLPRPPKVQEIETVLCKYKAHTRGQYEVGKDTREIIHGFGPWAEQSRIANHLKGVLEIQARKSGLLHAS